MKGRGRADIIKGKFLAKAASENYDIIVFTQKENNNSSRLTAQEIHTRPLFVSTSMQINAICCPFLYIFIVKTEKNIDRLWKCDR